MKPISQKVKERKVYEIKWKKRTWSDDLFQNIILWKLNLILKRTTFLNIKKSLYILYIIFNTLYNF